SSGILSTGSPSSKKWRDASAWVPVCEPNRIVDTLALAPFATACCSEMSISGLPGYTRPPVLIGTETSKIRLTAGCKATVVRGLRWEARRFARAEDEARDRCFEGRSVLPKKSIVPFHPAFARLQNAEACAARK